MKRTLTILALLAALLIPTTAFADDDPEIAVEMEATLANYFDAGYTLEEAIYLTAVAFNTSEAEVQGTLHIPIG